MKTPEQKAKDLVLEFDNIINPKKENKDHIVTGKQIGRAHV